MKAGTKVYFCIGDDVLAELMPYECNKEWQEHIEDCKEWSIEIDGLIDWNETWLVAYQARMYANYFRS